MGINTFGRQIIGGTFDDSMMFGLICEDYTLLLIIESTDKPNLYFESPDLNDFKNFLSLLHQPVDETCRTILGNLVRQCSFANIEFLNLILAKWKLLSNDLFVLDDMVSKYIDDNVSCYSDLELIEYTYNILEDVLFSAKRQNLHIQ